MTSHPLLTAKEVAALLRVDLKWIYRNSSRLEAIRLTPGKHPDLRFTREAVEKFLKEAVRKD